MSKQARASHPIYSLLPTEIEGFDSLAELALDMHWSWNHATDEVWRQLDPEPWGITNNPWVVLQTASRDRIERGLADPVFRKKVDGLREYTEQHYLPGAAAYRERAASKGSVGRKMVDWQHALEKEWPAIRFGETKVETDGEAAVV
jgi:hypothetical protein